MSNILEMWGQKPAGLTFLVKQQFVDIFLQHCFLSNTAHTVALMHTVKSLIVTLNTCKRDKNKHVLFVWPAVRWIWFLKTMMGSILLKKSILLLRLGPSSISALSQKKKKKKIKKSAWGACSINSQSKASVKVNSKILQILVKLSNSLCEVTLLKVPLL